MEALRGRAEVIERTLRRSFQAYEYGLRGARGAVLAMGEEQLRRQRFFNYMLSRDLSREFPGAWGFGLIRRVAPDQVEDFVYRAQRDGAPEFHIRQLQPQDGERYVIQYIEPEERNASAIGLDVASEPSRKQAADLATSSGQAILTAPITLVQANRAGSTGMLFLLPLYRSGSTPPLEETRRKEVWGWVYAPLVLRDILATTGLQVDDVSLQLTDLSLDHRGGALVPAPQGFVEHRNLAVNRQMALYGRQWELRIAASESFYLAHKQVDVLARAVVLALLSIVISVAGVIRLQARQRKELWLTTHARLGALVDSSLDAIVGKSLDGTITSWNPAAADLFGYSAQEAIGKRFGDLIVPEALCEEETRFLAAIRHGETIKQADTLRRRKDGVIIAVSMSIVPVCDVDGTVIGASSTVRDSSLYEAAVQKLAQENRELESAVEERTGQLHDARRRLRAVLDGVPSMIGYWDRDLINRVANHAYHDWYGVSPESLPGKHMRDLLGDALFQDVLPMVQGALSGQAQTFERQIVGPDGRAREALAHFLPDLVDGHVCGFYVIVHDVTDLVHGKRRLDEALTENRIILNTINRQLLYTITDADGVILDANERFCEMHGVARDDLLGKTHALFKSGEQSGAFWHGVFQVLERGEAWRGEICNRTLNGELLWFDTVIAPLPSTRIKGGRYIALRIDVTERKRSAAEISRLNNLLGGVLQAATQVSIIATDTDGVIEVFNTGAERISGYIGSSVMRRRTLDFLYDTREVSTRVLEWSRILQREVSWLEALTAGALQQGAETRDWTYICKDGTTVPVAQTVTVMREETGKVYGFLFIGFDVRVERRAADSLLRAKEYAEQASLAKSRFVANMSHEIRTPLNVVLGLLQVLCRTQLDEGQRDYVDNAIQAGRSLLGIINDVLDFSKIEAGHLHLDSYAFGLDEVLRETAASCMHAERGPDVEVLIEDAADIPATLQGDGLRLRQVLLNLLSNAIKFTERGQVLLQITVRARRPSDVRLRFTVIDTGIGIPAEQQAHIFQEFTQAESSTTRRFGGTGLGLTISRRLVALMGGELRLQSQPSEGSCFWFEANFGYLEPMLERVSAPGSALLLGGETPTQAVLSRQLSRLGWTVGQARGREDFLLWCETSPVPTRGMQVVFMNADCIPWLQALSEGRSVLELNRAPRDIVVVITYHGSVPPKANVNRPGVTLRTLPAPFTAAQLISVLTGHGPESGLDRTILARRLDGWRILVVEDQAMNRVVAERLLRWEGAEVVLADDGAKGVALARQYGARIDVILMDLQMPVMDGLAAAREILRSPECSAVPIYAMTANANTDDRQACLEVGMTGHIGKPFDIEDVVQTLLSLKEVAVITASPAQYADAVLPCCMEPYEVVLDRFGGQEDIYAMAMEHFLVAAQEAHSALRASAARGEETAAAGAVHTLKGIAVTVGAEGLAAACRALEDMRCGGGDRQAWLGEAPLVQLQMQLAQTHRAVCERLAGAARAAPDAIAAPQGVSGELLRQVRHGLQAQDIQTLHVLERLQTLVGSRERAALVDIQGQLCSLKFADARESWLALEPELARRVLDDDNDPVERPHAPEIADH